MSKVIAVIPTLGNNIQRLNSAILSVREFSNAEQPEIVVVNNSTSETIAGIEEVDELISVGLNLGYVGSLEYVRRKFDFKYLWSVQDDMFLQNDVLKILLQELDSNAKLAVASPVLVRNGIIPARTRAGIFTNPEKTEWKNIPHQDTGPDELDTNVDFSFVSGSGALFRKDALDAVGGFNLSLYPLMHVDVDICARFLRHGYGLGLVPTAHIGHEINGSTPKILGQVLNEMNAPIVRNFLESGETTETLPAESLDFDIVFAIARKSSYLMLELSKYHAQRLAEKDQTIETLRAENANFKKQNKIMRNKLNGMLNSRSWRLTRPFRNAKKVSGKS